MESFIYVYAFFLHTETIGKLGFLEWFLNTPSHHRVHHGKDDKYIDKNFGGVLIIWDRLFNTFQEEEEQPSYGITKPLRTLNPLKVIFHEWMDIVEDIRKVKDFRSLLVMLFGKP